MTDLSVTWQAPGMAAQQRAIVDRQLTAMFAGDAPQHFAVVGEILRRIAPLTLLDAGCSSGYYYDIAEFYAYQQVRYTGCDFNPEMVAMARRRNPGVQFDQADICHLPYYDLSFDAVLTGATVNHVPDWQAALGEIKRVARRYIILHRAWVTVQPTASTTETAYGQPMLQWHWNEVDLLAALWPFVLVERHNAEGRLTCGCESLTYLLERP